ncbi:MAG TPA: hypothetical protein VJ922_08580 [Actinomycetota bacterium]|nr:hypothetical protein [Actinomycetota bacterium]
MRRPLIAALAALAFLVAAAPAFAQTTDKPMEPAPPVTDVAPGSIEITKTGLSVDGKSVEAVPRDKEITLTLTLRNTGDVALKNVNVVLSGSREVVRVTDAEAALGDLAPGESADGEFAFVAEGECFEFLGIGGEATFEGGAVPLKIALAASCPGPRLALAGVAFDGGDGDEVAEPGETLRVTFELVNNGKDPAENVRATVKVSGDGLKATGNELEWPDIAPGATARNTSPLILTIGDDVQRQKPCEALPQPLPVEDPAIIVDDKALPPDSAVSSDGTVSSDGNTSSASDAPGSEPSSGGGEPGSSGAGATATEEPPVSVEPLPAQVESTPGSGSGTEPGAGGTEPGTIEPDPVPPDQIGEPVPLPEPVEPQPEPDPDDQPVAIQLLLTITATDHETATEWSNQMFCMAERGLATDAMPLAAKDSREDGASNDGGAALPISIAIGISVLAAVAHRKLLI